MEQTVTKDPYFSMVFNTFSFCVGFTERFLIYSAQKIKLDGGVSPTTQKSLTSFIRDERNHLSAHKYLNQSIFEHLSISATKDIQKRLQKELCEDCRHEDVVDLARRAAVVELLFGAISHVFVTNNLDLKMDCESAKVARWHAEEELDHGPDLLDAYFEIGGSLRSLVFEGIKAIPKSLVTFIFMTLTIQHLSHAPQGFPAKFSGYSRVLFQCFIQIPKGLGYMVQQLKEAGQKMKRRSSGDQRIA